MVSEEDNMKDLSLLRDGPNHDAEARILQRFTGLIYHITRKKVPIYLVEDAVCSCYLFLIPAIRKYDASKCPSFVQYMRGCIYRATINFIRAELTGRWGRKTKKVSFHEGNMEDSCPSLWEEIPLLPKFCYEEDYQLKEALDRLSPRLRKVMDLLYSSYEDTTLTEVARKIGCTVSTVWLRRKRAIEQLRIHLRNYND